MNGRIRDKLSSGVLDEYIEYDIFDEVVDKVTMEVEEVVEALVEEGVEDKEQDLEDSRDEIKELESKVCELEDKLHDTDFPNASLEDQMVKEWILENYETLKSIYQSGKPLREKRSLRISKRIILVGKAASGKDHARQLLQSRGMKYGVSYTTRPPRTGEVEGKDYFFLSVEEFEKKIEKGEFYEHVTFNGWYYGTTVEQMKNDDVFIMTPYGISKLKPEDRKNSFIIFFDIPYEIRKERLAQRSDADTVDRRLEADENDFREFSDFDIRITNPNF
jgi:guanylate kinase